LSTDDETERAWRDAQEFEVGRPGGSPASASGKRGSEASHRHVTTRSRTYLGTRRGRWIKGWEKRHDDKATMAADSM
jgi:hypothetical protein